MRISDWSSDVCSSDLTTAMKSVGEVMAIGRSIHESMQKALRGLETGLCGFDDYQPLEGASRAAIEEELVRPRSEEHTSELQSLMRSSYAAFCLKTKRHNKSPRRPDEDK